jgi:hypothetical protein
MTLSALGIFSAAGAGGGVSLSDYELIETQILGSTQTSIVFSNLGTYSSTYKHLQIRAVARTDQTGNSRAIAVRLNADTGSYYAWHILTGDGQASTVSSAAGATQNVMYLGQSVSTASASNAFGASVIDILDPYSTSKNKTLRSLAGSLSTTTPFIRLMSGAWFNTASLTSVTLLGEDLTSGFVSGSRFSIYGIKG